MTGQQVTRELVVELLDELLEVFPRKGVDVTKLAETYRNTLSDLAGEAVRYAVTRHLREGKYFPKPYELREHGQDWMRRNMPPPAVVAQHNGTHCHCGGEFRWLEAWRPRVDDKHVPLLSADGQWLRLERYERFLCQRCAPPSPYRADADAPAELQPAMAVMGPDGQLAVPAIVVRRHPAFAARASPSR